MINSNLPAGEVSKTKEALLKYCQLDTFAMVRIWQKIQYLF